MAIKNIFFDFDGVIIFSNNIRIEGYYHIFRMFDKKYVNELVDYHIRNGGLSRYNKIRYFYEKILSKPISDYKIQQYAEKYKDFMLRNLVFKRYLNNEVIQFLKDNASKYNFHIASGSDEKELITLTEILEIDYYFLSINGSPINKDDIVKNLLRKNKYLVNETILVGDSINDFDAAEANNISFIGYNNLEISNLGVGYLDHFNQIYRFL